MAIVTMRSTIGFSTIVGLSDLGGLVLGGVTVAVTVEFGGVLGSVIGGMVGWVLAAGPAFVESDLAAPPLSSDSIASGAAAILGSAASGRCPCLSINTVNGSISCAGYKSKTKRC